MGRGRIAGSGAEAFGASGWVCVSHGDGILWLVTDNDRTPFSTFDDHPLFVYDRCYKNKSTILLFVE